MSEGLVRYMRKRISTFLLSLSLVTPLVLSTSVAVHASEKSETINSSEKQLAMSPELLNTEFSTFSVPNKGDTGGGGYSQVFHQYGNSKNANATVKELQTIFVGWGLSFIPGLNYFASYLVSTAITSNLKSRSIVYYKTSTYVTKTATRGRQVRTTIQVYSDSARKNLLSTSTRLAYEF